ncbi:hypothetical protein FZ983_00670 [Azospirillum sp. B21]|uniref:hypothetical protein n=1 Tax=Azospirillum sp. B21 TaxID=2607496 RepID=UPI0011ECC65A|nr:hypothetical protein [Azospirillum sp. B21]KAA0583174.1 hypothetical protein FZ983_00670 [Azospirillum sp. B21]
MTRPPSPPRSPQDAFSVAELTQRAASLGAALEEARAEAEAGVLIDLAGLEDRVARLCAEAEGMPHSEARALLGPLGNLVAALDPLAAALADQQAKREHSIAAALAGRDDPHTARQRAAAAYGRTGPGRTDELP